MTVSISACATENQGEVTEATTTAIAEESTAPADAATDASDSGSADTSAAEDISEPEETSAESTVKPDETTAKPAETTAKPAETTAKPAETTAKPAVTTAKPAETTAKPEVTTTSGSSGAPTVSGTSDAAKAKQKVLDYIYEVYGNGTISGQQESTWMGSDNYEFDYIKATTGKLPAIRGLDYMNDDFKGVNERAIKWWNDGGIVTICWHCGCDWSKSWDECMKTEISDWDAVLTEGTPENKAFIAGMDKAAAALKELQEAGVPVLWRPFHELDGGWFWWSKGGAENFKKLWIMMHDRYTNYWGLDNLIWVYGYSHQNTDMRSWYVGDEYTDIVGADSYTEGSNARLYNTLRVIIGTEKPICFHECGVIPTPELLQKTKAGWVYFMTWHTSYITDSNDPATLKEIFNSDYVITLDELPSFK